MSFTYRPPKADVLKRRADGDYGDTRADIIDSGIPLWKPGEGQHRIRILPATWEGAEYYGYPIDVHYGVGDDGDRFVCPRQFGDTCAICAARFAAFDEGDREYAKTLFPTRRVLYWIIDRDAANPQPLLWVAPATKIDREIAAQAFDDTTGELLLIDNPDSGYDVVFSKSGQGIATQWTGVKIARRPSPIHTDPAVQSRILEYIAEHPLPSCVVRPDPDAVARAFGTQARSAAQGGEEVAAPQDDIDDDIPF